MKRCLIVFAKEPEKGRVKTRLADCLSGAERLNLYKAFLKDTVRLARKIRCETRILAYASNKNPVYLKKVAANFVFYKQRGKGLGMRIHNAFKFASKNNADTQKTVLIGSDSPLLPANYIKKAFQELERKDVVLGPADDGGYYLVGLKKPCLGLFKGIKWSSAQVLKSTIKNIKSREKSFSFLDRFYDVDICASLSRLRQDLRKQKNTAPWTRRFLKI